MSQISPEFIESCQLEFERNPQSKVFAPLAEAYRKMGLLEEAERICQRGTQLHPEFVGGLVAYAKVLVDVKQMERALEILLRATQLSPDNILAHSLTGESLLALRKPKEALKSFKMVLFLNPHDPRAQEMVKKWEFLSAGEFPNESFSMRTLDEILADGTSRNIHGSLERALSMADSLTIRNEMDRAVEILERARQALGPSAEVDRRLKRLSPPRDKHLRRARLQELLHRIQTRRLDS